MVVEFMRIVWFLDWQSCGVVSEWPQPIAGTAFKASI